MWRAVHGAVWRRVCARRAAGAPATTATMLRSPATPPTAKNAAAPVPAHDTAVGDAVGGGVAVETEEEMGGEKGAAHAKGDGSATVLPMLLCAVAT